MANDYNLDDYLEGYDTSGITPASGQSEPVPEGEYVLEVSALELKATSAGTGMYLSAQMKILDGEYEGRMIFSNFNVKNPNPKAMEIGLREFAALAVACGSDLETAKRSTSLVVNVPFYARVGIEPGKGDYGPKNKILKFHAPDAGAPPSAAPPAPPPAARPSAPPPSRPAPRPPAGRPAAGRPAAGGGLPWGNRRPVDDDIHF